MAVSVICSRFVVTMGLGDDLTAVLSCLEEIKADVTLIKDEVIEEEDRDFNEVEEISNG